MPSKIDPFLVDWVNLGSEKPRRDFLSHKPCELDRILMIEPTFGTQNEILTSNLDSTRFSVPPSPFNFLNAVPRAQNIDLRKMFED